MICKSFFFKRREKIVKKINIVECEVWEIKWLADGGNPWGEPKPPRSCRGTHFQLLFHPFQTWLLNVSVRIMMETLSEHAATLFHSVHKRWVIWIFYKLQTGMKSLRQSNPWGKLPPRHSLTFYYILYWSVTLSVTRQTFAPGQLRGLQACSPISELSFKKIKHFCRMYPLKLLTVMN